MISTRSLWRWAAVSNERAVANARAAATECARLRVERAEVEQYLSALAPSASEVPAQPTTEAVAAGR